MKAIALEHPAARAVAGLAGEWIHAVAIWISDFWAVLLITLLGVERAGECLPDRRAHALRRRA
jgi:hypothetical protein